MCGGEDQKIMYTTILGTGSYLPSQVVTNAMLEESLETTDAWIVTRTGIKERRFAQIGESTCSMACLAAERAIQSSRIAREQIGLVIVATSTSEYAFPSIACSVQANLDLPGGIAFDLAAACAGFVYALSVADQYIRAGVVAYALVIGSELFSKVLDPNDRSTKILFGDGAGAVVLGSSATSGILWTKLASNGEYGNTLQLPTHPLSSEATAYLSMKGNEIFRLAVSTLTQLAQEMMQVAKEKGYAVDWFIPHQANLRIIRAVANNIGLDEGKLILTLEREGNTGAASIPLALDAAVRGDKLKLGDTILLEAFGGGLAWGGALVRW
eukprot:Blabericola_migrator_1__7781@NODE_3983_length_1397_cov_6_828571_g2455_i0_p1_GENE_NODE_3983_length_1397_cov_6_828571_g2455_i0NODE_3983_length_1397_cov_6_828571_g2455_i0_p1_ORF_typecomplete_len326_score23_21ACP_syn_III_C/PF08541_10/1_9e02ACP_syn_III_C/PF08541_10/2_4e26ACP_syn_III/PF08545_10/1_7e03ACP_syn_III/PF08545_10/1_2e27HMG_CoA_synt_N/PF01154_17/3_2e17Chal_sti_synt_N/PF00195_19/5_2e14FAE1_CUT1_RppA/PF08392_12/4_8e13Thiolase_N/PF00108_23/7_5e06Thiolase_N/PF00108_23/5_9e02Thiolase_N/PF00108_23/